MQVEGHGEVPREHAHEVPEAHREDHREIPLLRMRRVQFAPLVPESLPHARARPPPPRRAALGQHAHVEAHGQPDVAQAQRGEDRHEHEVARDHERGPQPHRLLRDADFAVRPREDVRAPEEDQHHQDEGDRQERDVALEQADHRARPARRRDALHGDEHHRRLGDRREVQPVDEQRLPDPVAALERAVGEDDDAHEQQREAREVPRPRDRLGGRVHQLRATGEVRIVVGAHGVLLAGAARRRRARPAPAGSCPADDRAPGASARCACNPARCGRSLRACRRATCRPRRRGSSPAARARRAPRPTGRNPQCGCTSA